MLTNITKWPEESERPEQKEEYTVINMVGKTCPIPVIEAKKALRQAGPGQVVQLLVDNEVARENLARLAQGLACNFSAEQTAEGHIQVSITKAAAAGSAMAPQEALINMEACSGGGGGLVVAIGSCRMGQGEGELGEALIKSFIYALTELDLPPEHLLFFNSGIQLTTAGAGTLKDLQALADKGASISTCGACLNFYGLTDQLAIGSVTNMYAITATMAQAGHLINL